MSDPAIEAAQRAWTKRYPSAEGFNYSLADNGVAAHTVAAAREMAKSVQELHKPVVFTSLDGEQWIECSSCRGEYFPCETAKRVYPSEELGL